MTFPRLLLLGVVLLSCIALPWAAHATMERSVGQWSYTSQHGSGIGEYLIFRPADSAAAGAEKASLPLLIFLHGAGYRGYDLGKLDNAFIPQAIAEGRDFPALVLCPQVDSYWTGRQASEFITQALEKHRGQFDPDRVYLTGESAGGGGAWEGAKLEARNLAAVVAIATTLGRPELAEELKNLPVWAFHNINDPYQGVEKSKTQVRAVKEAGGQFVFLTLYADKPGKQKKNGEWPNTHRHAWETAYQDPALWDWLFRQRRGQPEQALQPPPAPTLGQIVPSDDIP